MFIALMMAIFAFEVNLAAEFKSSASSAKFACWQRTLSLSQWSRRFSYFEPGQREVKGLDSMVPARGTFFSIRKGVIVREVGGACGVAVWRMLLRAIPSALSTLALHLFVIPNYSLLSLGTRIELIFL